MTMFECQQPHCVGPDGRCAWSEICSEGDKGVIDGSVASECKVKVDCRRHNCFSCGEVCFYVNDLRKKKAD